MVWLQILQPHVKCPMDKLEKKIFIDSGYNL